MRTNHLDDAAPSRKTPHRDDAAKLLTDGGRVIYRRTQRCPAFCNTVAALAGIGQVEVR